MLPIRYSLLVLYSFCLCLSTVHCLRKFPDGFTFGVSTSAYQIEGAWNESGKGESIWDHLTHYRPELIKDRSNGDIACDSYQNYKRDVEMLSEIGSQFYRFSLSWTRLCPTGICVNFNKAGLDYYNNLINELIKHNIQPAITLYHWDLPQKLQYLGGWTNPIIAQYFEWYAKKAFEEFGDRVKLWVTFNEPKDMCLLGYSMTYNAPALNYSGVPNYLCADTFLKAHARVYRMYQELFKKEQNGRVGLTFSTHWYAPADNTSDSIKAAEIFNQFEAGLYTHAIFSKEGDYPKIVRELVDKRSAEQGLPVSRLPILDKKDIEMIKGASDFFGVNHYTTKLANMAPPDTKFAVPSYEDDHRVVYYQNQSWRGASAPWLKVVPWGFKNLLKWIKDSYDNPEVIIFENGFGEDETFNDTGRVEYLKEYLNALLDAVDEGCNITGYSVWTLMDNFEWMYGYTHAFGLYHVDFNDPKRTRTPKTSVEFYRNVIKNHAV